MQTTKTTFIYGLVAPGSNEVRYVGKADDPYKRVVEHLRSGTPNAIKREWIAALHAEGFIPAVVILEEVPADEWQAAERKWIQSLKDQGHQILNIDDGGYGGESKAIRKRMASFRLEKETVDLMCQLSETSTQRFGTHLSQAQIVEKAVREMVAHQRDEER